MVCLDSGKRALRNLIHSIDAQKTDRNEAQTRFHIIDTLLETCLGWSRVDIEVEKAERQKFTDYELGAPRLAILEAKREGRAFDLPATLSKSLLVDLPSICTSSHEAKEAIEQAQEYCSRRGVAIAIVTNGHQYICFLASRQDGRSVLDAKALVFKSLQHMHDNFTVAWKMLSSAGIKDRNINRYLSNGFTGIPRKLSSRLDDFPKIRYASDLQSTLKQLSELLIQDIVENPELEKRFFSNCYCESGALSKYSLLSKNILEARYEGMFSTTEPHPRAQSVKSKNQNNFSPDIMTEALSRRPIVLIGDVGVGKTSFVKNLIYNSAHNEFKNAIYVYIDLGSNASLSANLKEFVLSEIERQLHDKYSVDTYEYNFIRTVYSVEISRFSKGLWGKLQTKNPDKYEEKLFNELDSLISVKDQHLKRSIAYLSRSRHKQVIISLDNADQREFDIQQDAFIISQELAKEWNATVFMAVRPQTFYKSKRSGALTAYPHKIFTISPPRVDQMIEKRLLFALGMAEGSIPLETIDFVKLNLENLATFLKVLIQSLHKNRELQEFLTNITGGNIRSVIEFVTGFIGSPNVEAEKIIKIMEETGEYVIPIHEFTKSALLGDYSHYNPDTSIAMNIFDVATADSNEHFLVPIISSFLITEGEHKDKDGFCSTTVIFEELQNYGFTSIQIESALRRSTNKKLLETSQRFTFEEDETGLIGEMPTSFRITSIGAYHLQRWLGTFTYIDAMVFDTPIFNEERLDNMLDNLKSLSIEDRYKRAQAFKEYLIVSWKKLHAVPPYFDLLDSFKQNQHSFERVNKAIKRNNQ